MSRTDKTTPWWVRMAERPGVTYLPAHDHRDGVCTLPDDITPESASLNRRLSGCHWIATNRYLFDRGGLTGGREWYHIRRETRRRSRRSRRELRAYCGED